MKNFFTIILLSLSLLSCSKSDSNTEVNIRVRNVSTYNFENLSILDFSIENLAPNETTEFRPFEKAYRIATLFLEINGEEYGFQVTDFVGETPLPNGSYTYEIGFDTQEKVLTITVVEYTF